MDLITPTIARLQALEVAAKPVFLDVDSSLELAGIIEQGNPQRSPTAYVVLNSETPATAVEGTGPAVQRIGADVVVVIAIKATNTVQPVSGSLAAVQRQVIDALFDWAPDTDADPYTRGPSKLLTFRNGWIYWADSFRTDYWE